MAGPVAKFKADFSDFTRQVREGIRSVEELQRASGVSEAGIQRMERAFSGERIIRDATEAAQAVERIGGASRLTEAEQARVNRTVQEALAKYKALGVEAPADLQRLASATDNAAEKVRAFQNPLEQVKQAMGAAFSVHMVKQAFTAFTEFTGKLTDLSAKTGIGTSALQALNLVTMQAGLEMEQVAAGVSRMGRNLVEGNSSAVAGVKALGLSTSDLLRMSPDQAFATIGEKIAGIKNPAEQSAAAVAIFGKNGADYLPAFTTNMRAALDEAQRSGPILGDSMVKAGDEAGDALDRLKLAGITLLGNMFGPLAPAIQAVADGMGTALPAALNVARGLFDGLILVGMQVVLKIREMALSIMELTREVPILGDKIGYSDDRLRAMRASVQEARDTITGFTTQAVKPAQGDLERAAGKSDELSGAFGRNKESADKNKAAIQALTREITGEGLTQQVRNLEAVYKSLTPEQRQNDEVIQRLVERYGKLRDQAGTEVSPALEQLYERTTTLKSRTIDLKGALAELRPALKDSSDEIVRLRTETIEGARSLTEGARTAKEWAAAGAVLAPALQSVNVQLELQADKEARLKQLRDGLRGLSQSLAQLAQVSGPLEGLTQWLSTLVARADTVEQAGTQFKEALSSLRTEGGNTATSMIQLASATLSLSAAFVQAITTGNTFQRTLSGMQVGAQFGAQFGPAGAAIGAVVGGLSGLISGLGRVSEETKKVRSEISSFEEGLRKNLSATQAVEAAGRTWASTTIAVRDAYLATGRTAAEAEAIVKQLWDDKNPNAARAAMEKINAVMEEAKKAAEALDKELNGALGEAVSLGVTLPEHLKASIQSLVDMGKITGDNAALFATLTGDSEGQFKAMEEAAKKYGVELSALGPAFAQNRLDQQARDIIDAFDAMTRGGGDVTGVIAGMSDEINQFVADAISSGRTVPENMRPILEAMLEQGRLTDENGNKLEDLSGINFGPPIESAFDRIIAKLEELINRIADPSGFDQMYRNADYAGRGVADIFDTTITPAIERAEDAVNGLNFGHSPGGLKEIPILSKAAGDAIEGFSSRAGNSVGSTYRSLDDLLKQIRSVGIEFDTIKPKDEEGNANEFAGFVIPNVGLISEAQALDRIKKVAEFYGRQISDTEAGKILESYGYKGGGRVIKTRLDKFLQELTRKFVEDQYTGFADGTKGRTGRWFANFGRGTPAVLHGDEAVVPRSQAAAFAADMGGGQPGLAAELAGLRADFQLLPQVLARAVRDAVLVAG